MSGGVNEEAIEQERERERESRYHSHNLGNGQQTTAEQEFIRQKQQYLETLTETGMTDAEINLLDNMIDKAWVLGNLTAAETHDIKWRMHTMYLKIKALFPPQRSAMQGAFRAFIYDDPSEEITALSEQQKTIIAQMIIGISYPWISRSKEGFEREMQTKSINESIVRNPDDQDDGYLRGLFS